MRIIKRNAGMCIYNYTAKNISKQLNEVVKNVSRAY